MKLKSNYKNLKFMTKNTSAYSPTGSYTDIPTAKLIIPKDGVYELRFSSWMRLGIDGIYSFGRVRFTLNGNYIDKTERRFRIENDNATYARRDFDICINKIVNCKAGDIFTVQAIEEDNLVQVQAGVIEYQQIG